MSAGFATLVARGARSSGVRQIVVLPFDQIVDSFAPNVVSYWKFQNSGTDEMAQEDAPFTGFPEANIETIVKFDTIAEGAPANGTCIAWPGTDAGPGDYAQAPHDPAHKTASGTIVVYFQRDAADFKSQLIEADANGAAGGMAIGININGAPDAYIRGTPGGTPVIVTAGFGAVLLDNAYCLIFKWTTTPGGGGMRLALWNAAGALVSFATNTGAAIGLSGTSTIRFGATHNNTNFHNGPYGRVIWMNRRITDAEEAIFGALARTISRSAISYRETELSMGPLALWGLGDAFGPTLTDAVGTRHGTYSGVVTHDAPDLPDNSADGSANFGNTGSVAGTGSGSVPAAGLSLAVFSLSFWFIANRIPEEGDPGVPIVIKGAATPVEGDFSFFIRSNGVGVARLNLRAAASTVAIDTPAVDAGTRYHVCVRANNTGTELYFDGALMGGAPTITTGWSNNTNPLTFATGLDFAALGNCIIDEVCLIPRFITVAEVITLAQRSGIDPIAVGTPAIVPENVTTVLDVLANDTYVGSPTIEIMADPGSGDIVTVVPATSSAHAHVTYQAGNVGADTVRSFDYRITDPNGTSNTVTVSVTIQADDFVADPIANCFQIPGLSSVTVNTMADLETEVNAAAPGDHILIPPGTYAGGSLTFTAVGTAANPIVIRPTTGRNNVTISNGAWRTALNSARIVIYGLNFSSGGVSGSNNRTVTGALDIRGSHHRITRCQFRQADADQIVLREATDTRIDHCDFSDHLPNSPNRRRGITLEDAYTNNGTLDRTLIDYCYFHDSFNNGQAYANTIYTGGGVVSGRHNGHIVIDHCLMARVHTLSGGEFILVKHSGVTIRYCTFKDLPDIPLAPNGNNYVRQYLQQRQGAGLEVRSCWFENMATSPLLVFDYEALQAGVAGRTPLIIGNRFIGTSNLTIGAGGGEVTPPPPEQPGGDGYYNACCNGRFIGNRMGSGFIRVGTLTTAGGLVEQDPAEDNFLQANTRDADPGGPAHQLFNENRTTISGAAPTEPFDPAVELNPVEVGLGAPDPLCPLGP